MRKRNSPDQSKETKCQCWYTDIVHDFVNPILVSFFIFPEITINRTFINICSSFNCCLLFGICFCCHVVKIKNPFGFVPKGFRLIFIMITWQMLPNGFP